MLETRKGGRPSRRPDKETLQHLSDMLTIEQIAQLYCVDVLLFVTGRNIIDCQRLDAQQSVRQHAN